MRVDVEVHQCYVEFCGTIWQVMGIDLTDDLRAFTRLEHRFGPQPPSPVLDVFGDDLNRLTWVSEMEVIAWAARAA